MEKLKAVFKFVNDWHYRDEIIEKYWNWKSKIIVVLLTLVVAFNLLTKIDYFGHRWIGYKQCFGEEWDTGRDTKFGFIFNSCVIDSGKRDGDGEVVWQKVKRDLAVGDFQ